VTYRVTFPAPEHHWLQVEVTFSALGSTPLRARMSRSSPGRYAVHEFAKNIFKLDAYDSAGRKLSVARPDVDEWRIDRHDGTVRVVYQIFGDFPDGTYMGVDTTHAHLNIPATFLWAVGLESRPIQIAFVPPAGSGWIAGTQLYPTPDPLAFTAPNLQYFMDSPVELARLTMAAFDVTQAVGPTARFRIVAHGGGSQADIDGLAPLVARLVREERAVFGAFPVYEPGVYTFILDLVDWADGDAMEHRNSTYISLPGVRLDTSAGREEALDAIAHEFFHNWNVERIRPAGLEPFDFTRENITCCLWLAEGFTQYYGPLLLQRAGLAQQMPLGLVGSVINGSGRLVRSAVEMSEHGPFADAGVANDTHDRSRTFISYYTYGAAVALALDLSLRDVSGGRLSLDDYMARLWRDFGQGAAAPGLVARPYSLADLRATLAALTANQAFADTFFDRFIEGRDVADYARLLGLAGYTLRRVAPDRAWTGTVAIREETGGLRIGRGAAGRDGLVPFGTPAYEAGIDTGDLITTIDDQPATMAAWTGLTRRRAGDAVRLGVTRRDGARAMLTLTLGGDPTVLVTSKEATGAALTAAERAFRDAWFSSKVR
jgi:predicted metalloprotease with PDZ domain